MRRRVIVWAIALTLALGFAWGSQAVDQGGIVWGDALLMPQPTGFPPQGAQPTGFPPQAVLPSGFGA